MKVLIDTNVILDALMVRQPWAESAQNILRAVAGEKVEGFITASTITDIYYLLDRGLKDKMRTKQVVLALLSSISVLDVNGTDCRKAFELPMSDYEDALLAYCGKRHRVDLIVTRNPKDFVGSPVNALSPDELLKKLR
ncbi:MAG: PIN domain-containing protein [Coriobacteriales bacterium]|jgi:predicted nucleic acid-binding protein|nr:PIN domain-containing protein [Coriobacteriales bacterium]